MNGIIFVYLAMGVVVVGLGVLLYLRAVASRKRYACPKCGEKLSVELMKARRCNMCGAPLDEKNGSGTYET